MAEYPVECIDDDVVHAFRAGVARGNWWRLWKVTRYGVRPVEPACWELRTDDNGVTRRVRLWGRKDFTGATSNSGRRGVMMWFHIEAGSTYIVRKPLGRGRSAYIQIRLQNNEVIEEPLHA